VATAGRQGKRRQSPGEMLSLQPMAKTTKMTPNRQSVKLTTTVSLPF